MYHPANVMTQKDIKLTTKTIVAVKGSINISNEILKSKTFITSKSLIISQSASKMPYKDNKVEKKLTILQNVITNIAAFSLIFLCKNSANTPQTNEGINKEKPSSSNINK